MCSFTNHWNILYNDVDLLVVLLDVLNCMVIAAIKLKHLPFFPKDEEGPSKLEKILSFATGATAVPPIGFNPTPSIGFLHEEEYGDTAVSSLPIANTCINCLKLPLHNSYAVFKDKMDFALANTQGFGRA